MSIDVAVVTWPVRVPWIATWSETAIVRSVCAAEFSS
jgi:hypothetical protein